MKRRVLRKYTSVLMICIMLCALVLQNVYAFGIPVVTSRSGRATASNATMSNATSSDAGSKEVRYSHWDRTVSMVVEADSDAAGETEIYLYLKNNGDSWILDGQLSCTVQGQDGADSYFTAIEQLDEDGEWAEAVFPDEVIGYETDDFQERELVGIALQPGAVYRMVYHYAWDDSEEPETDGLAVEELKFSFKGEDESGKGQAAKTSFQYHTDGWNLKLAERDDAQTATISDASFTVDINGWKEMLGIVEEKATSSNASGGTESMTALSWDLTADARVEEIRTEDNGDGTVTFYLDLKEDAEAGAYFAEVGATGRFMKETYRTSVGTYFAIEGVPEARQTEYRYEDDDVAVTATVTSEHGGALPYGSELVAEKITDSAQLEEIAERIFQATGQTYDCSRAYDIHFLYEGEEVEPVDAEVKVQMQYKDAVLLHESVKQTPEPDVKVLHLTDKAVVEDVTGEIVTNDEGDVEAASFETSGFSIFVLTQVIPNGTRFRYEDDAVIVAASVNESAGIPADGQLVVELIGQEDERYQAVKTKLEEEKEKDGETSPQSIPTEDLILYDFYFRDARMNQVALEDGAEIQMDFTYKNPSPQSAKEETKTVAIYQITPDQSVIEVAGTTVVAGTELQSVSVKANGIGMLGVPRATSLYEYSSKTLFDEGGNYSIYYILNNFNIFTKGDAASGHCIGPAAVGGKAAFPSGNGTQKYEHTTPTYFQGKIEIVLDGFMKTFYVGEANVNGEFTPQSRCETYISKNDCYIDFDEAFRQIEEEADRLASFDRTVKVLAEDVEKGKTATVVREHYKVENFWKKGCMVTVDEGYSYEFEDISAVGVVNVDGKADKYGNAALVDMSEGTVELPQIFVNGSSRLPGTDQEVGEALGVAFIVPNADKVDCTGGWERWIGHIVAPNAEITGMIGDANGCFIGKTYDNPGTECHMWPYNGSAFVGSSWKASLGKKVDGQMPAKDQTFQFVLQEMNLTERWEQPDVTISGIKLKGGNVIETRENYLGTIDFDAVRFTVKDEGDHYYKVYEKVPETDSQFNYDLSCYYFKVSVEVEVTATVGQNQSVLTTTTVKINNISYWKADSKAEAITEKPVIILPEQNTGMVVTNLQMDAYFNNTHKLEVILPETGGFGARTLLNTSLWLFAFGLAGMTCSSRNKERREKKQEKAQRRYL